MSKSRRAAKIVDYEVQHSLLRKVAVHWVALLVAQFFGLFCWTVLLQMPLESWSSTLQSFQQTSIPLLFVSLALLPIFLLDTVKLSNRFAGPVMRIRRSLQAYLAGEVAEPVRFRDNDFWRPLAEEFNQALDLRRKEIESPVATAGTPQA